VLSCIPQSPHKALEKLATHFLIDNSSYYSTLADTEYTGGRLAASTYQEVPSLSEAKLLPVVVPP
jgi:hypothetical protein